VYDVSDKVTKLWLLASAVVDIFIAYSMTYLVCYNNRPEPIGLIILKAPEASEREINPFYNGPAEAYPAVDLGNKRRYW